MKKSRNRSEKRDHKIEYKKENREESVSKACRFYMIALILVFSVLVFVRLGSTKAPKTALPIRQGGMIQLSFSQKTPSHMIYYMGPGADRESYYDLYFGKTGDETGSETELMMEQVFSWQAYTLPDPTDWDVMTLRLKDERAILFELVFLDAQGNVIYPDNAAAYEALFDETTLLPREMSAMTETYFDEVYHARTGFDYLHRLPAYDGVHPPLGKILIMISIGLFGMNPFGWRFMNAVFGILIIPVMFSFGKKLTKNEWIGAFGATLYTFDFMHFAESRIATLDIFCAFFILLMYERFLAFCLVRRKSEDWGKQKKILLGGALATACAVSCKWTGIFAGFGLAVMFLVMWIAEGRSAGKQTQSKERGKNTKGLSREIRYTLASYFGLTGIVYFFSYIPHISFTNPEAGLLERFIIQQNQILSYHTGLIEKHPYESRFWEWPLMNRPLFMTGYPEEETVRTYVTFGNPIVWWGGLAALLLVLVLSIMDLAKKKDSAFAQRGIFLILSYLAQYLPWALVERSSFIYHYFPCVAFLTGALALLMMRLWDRFGKKKAAAFMITLAAGTICLFCLFYPVLSGMRVSKAYIHNTLEWGSRWDLTGCKTEQEK
ncbi:MAG: phospholipid carrier-dependent glycosyltransferase [Lachnospiraceae bacterium]|nr:phospholipid carrier-dependent glycosyltransferase [Lachnospiraceae bacterium]